LILGIIKGCRPQNMSGGILVPGQKECAWSGH